MADVSRETSIAKKIASQCSAWTASGHEVAYFALAAGSACWEGLRQIEVHLTVSSSKLARFKTAWELPRRVRAWRPDLVYFRFGYHSPGLPALFAETPTIAEINSDDLREYPLTLGWMRVCYHRLTRRRILKNVRGFVAMTGELAERFQSWRRPITVIGNSIALRDFNTLPTAGSGPTRLIFMGTAGSPWHGLERVAELSTLLPEMQFDVVGLDHTAWLRQTGLGPQHNVHLHGELTRQAYEPILAASTAALGSLALYKNGMDEACPLKVREYLALGLPVVGAHKDTDIPESADYFLRLPNSAGSLRPHVDPIRKFLNTWRNKRVSRSDVAHLDTATKERQRLEFMERIASSDRS